MHLLFSFGLTAIVWLMAFASVSHAMYPSNSDVIDLTPSNFNKLVIQSDEVWIVEVCLYIMLLICCILQSVYYVCIVLSSMPLGVATAKT